MKDLIKLGIFFGLGYLAAYFGILMLGFVYEHRIFFAVYVGLFVIAYFIAIAKRYRIASERERTDIKIYLCALSSLLLLIAAFVVWLVYDLGYLALGLVALIIVIAIIVPTPHT